MNLKLTFLCATFLIVLSAASLNAGQVGPTIADWGTMRADLLLNSYEMKSDTTMAGMDTLEAGTTQSWSNTIGVTEGTYSLGISVPTAEWRTAGILEWDWPLTYPIEQNQKLFLDVTVPTGSASATDTFSLSLVINGGAGWKQGPMLNMPADGITRTYEYDYGTIASSGGWAQIFAVTSSGEQRTFYVDNLRVAPVPEPATIVLLAFAGLGLLVWRKR